MVGCFASTPARAPTKSLQSRAECKWYSTFPTQWLRRNLPGSVLVCKVSLFAEHTIQSGTHSPAIQFQRDHDGHLKIEIIALWWFRVVGRGQFFKNSTLKWYKERPRSGQKGVIPRSRHAVLTRKTNSHVQPSRANHHSSKDPHEALLQRTYNFTEMPMHSTERLESRRKCFSVTYVTPVKIWTVSSPPSPPSLLGYGNVPCVPLLSPHPRVHYDASASPPPS